MKKKNPIGEISKIILPNVLLFFLVCWLSVQSVAEPVPVRVVSVAGATGLTSAVNDLSRALRQASNRSDEELIESLNRLSETNTRLVAALGRQPDPPHQSVSFPAESQEPEPSVWARLWRSLTGGA